MSQPSITLMKEMIRLLKGMLSAGYKFLEETEADKNKTVIK